MKRCASVLVDMMKFPSKISRKLDKNSKQHCLNSIKIRSKFDRNSRFQHQLRN